MNTLDIDMSSEDNPGQKNQLQEVIFSTLEDHGALSTRDVAFIVGDNTKTVEKKLNQMADIGQIEKRETNNEDVWLIWKNIN